jgi:hypothetical protein
MANSFVGEKLKFISIALCILSLLLLILSQFIAWVAFDVDTSLSGLASADIELDAEFYEARVEYKAEAKNISTGAAGGLIGGFIDLGGIMEGGNITIEPETIYYVEGLGRFQELVGAIYGTTKDADYWINPKTDNSDNTKITVNTHTDLIPWWPEGLAQEMTITVQLNQTDNVKHVLINEVYIEIYSDWDEKERKYTSSALEVWKIEPGDYLYKQGDKKVYKHGVTVEREWGDRVGIIAMVDLTLTDNQNETDYAQLKPFPSEEHPQEMVNIIPITQGQATSIVLIVLSFPVTIIALILTAIALFLVIFQKRHRMHLLLSAAIVEWLAVSFFVIGASTLLGLIEFLKEEWVSWNVIGLLIPILAGAALFIAFILEIVFRPKEIPKEEVKFDISAAIGKEEEGIEGEEEEAFQCPQCGRIFYEFVPECPDCGAEFEGVDEEEEFEEGEEKEKEEKGEVEQTQDLGEEDGAKKEISKKGTGEEKLEKKESELR